MFNDGSTLKNSKSLRVFMGGLGGLVFALNILMIFLPKQPSAEEVAVSKLLDKVTGKMDELHKETMAELS